jgi:hypothetical protein
MTRSPSNVVAFPGQNNTGRLPPPPDDSRDIYEWWKARHPEIMQLPFVTRIEGRDGEFNINFWNVQSSDGIDDIKRGRKYAKLTIAALGNAKYASVYRALEMMFEAIVTDAIARRAKGGKGSRTNITSVGNGFLSELSKFIHRASYVQEMLQQEDA